METGQFPFHTNFLGLPILLDYLAWWFQFWAWARVRASLLGLCLNSLHKADVWAYALGLRSRPMHILFSTPLVSNVSIDIFSLLSFTKKGKRTKIYFFINYYLSIYKMNMYNVKKMHKMSKRSSNIYKECLQ